jgi:hypothetical protein
VPEPTITGSKMGNLHTLPELQPHVHNFSISVSSRTSTATELNKTFAGVQPNHMVERRTKQCFENSDGSQNVGLLSEKAACPGKFL